MDARSLRSAAMRTTAATTSAASTVIARRRARRAVADDAAAMLGRRPRSAPRPPDGRSLWRSPRRGWRRSCATAAAAARSRSRARAPRSIPTRTRAAGTGRDAPARVVGAHDEAQPLGRGGQRGRRSCATPSNQSARPGAGRRALTPCGRRQRPSIARARSRAAWPNGKRDPERQRAIPQRMAADRLGRRPRRQHGRNIDRASDDGTEGTDSIGAEKIALRAPRVPAPRSRRADAAPRRQPHRARSIRAASPTPASPASATWRRGARADATARSRRSALSASR